MNRKLTALLLLVALVGCAKKDPSLPMDANEIRTLCSKVGLAAFGRANEGKDKISLDWIEQGAKAQCELEHRIKQQEANKSF